MVLFWHAQYVAISVAVQVERWVASKCSIEKKTFETTLLRVLEPLRQQVVLALAKPVLHCTMVSEDLRGDAKDAKDPDPIPRCVVCATVHEAHEPPSLKFEVGQIWFEGQVEIELSSPSGSIHKVAFGWNDVVFERKWLPSEISAACHFHFRQALCISWKQEVEGSEFKNLQRYTSKDEPKVIELGMSDQDVDLWMSILGQEQRWWVNQWYHRPICSGAKLLVLALLVLALLLTMVDCIALHHLDHWEQTLQNSTSYAKDSIKRWRTGL